MDILTTIADFKNHLKALGYAESTLESYRKNLDLFCRYLQGLEVADMRKVTHALICDYQQAVMAEADCHGEQGIEAAPGQAVVRTSG